MATLMEVARCVREEHIENPDALTLVYKRGRSWQFASLEVGGFQPSNYGVNAIDLDDVQDGSCYYVIDPGDAMLRLRGIYDCDCNALILSSPIRTGLVKPQDLGSVSGYADFIKSKYGSGVNYSRNLSSALIRVGEEFRRFSSIATDYPAIAESEEPAPVEVSPAPASDVGNTDQQVNPAPVENTDQRVTLMPGELCPKCVHAAECPADERGAVIECADFTRRPADDGFGFFADDAGDTNQRVTPLSADGPGQSDAGLQPFPACAASSRCYNYSPFFCLSCAENSHARERFSSISLGSYWRDKSCSAV